MKYFLAVWLVLKTVQINAEVNISFQVQMFILMKCIQENQSNQSTDSNISK